jgi:hypothetical protein
LKRFTANDSYTLLPQKRSTISISIVFSHWLGSQIDAAATFCDRVFYHPEYHGRVFGAIEINQIIDRFGIPDREWQTQIARKYDLFIEVQVWEAIEWY